MYESITANLCSCVAASVKPTVSSLRFSVLAIKAKREVILSATSSPSVMIFFVRLPSSTPYDAVSDAITPSFGVSSAHGTIRGGSERCAKR